MAPNGNGTAVPFIPPGFNHKPDSLDGNDSTNNTMLRPPTRAANIGDIPPLVNGVQSRHPNTSTPESMRIELERRKTYALWPVTYMDPNKLAAAGFFYYNCNDLVRCAFCNLEMGQWEEGDDPFREHQRWSPTCYFVRKLPVGNVPINTSSPSFQLMHQQPVQDMPNGHDTCGLYGIEFKPFSAPERETKNGEISLEKLGINKSRGPVFPNYSTYESRQRSYKNWPVSLKQRPDQLSEAGFYYTGVGDQTICFHCGGGLKDWEQSDDPWKEHAQWFSKCTFLILVKGMDFIAEVCNTKKAILTPEEIMNIKPPQELEGKLQIQKVETLNKVDPPAPEETKPVSAKQGTQTSDACLCKICFTEELGVVFLPCAHMVACVKCAPSLSICAVCRKPFSATVRAFLS